MALAIALLVVSAFNLANCQDLSSGMYDQTAFTSGISERAPQIFSPSSSDRELPNFLHPNYQPERYPSSRFSQQGGRPSLYSSLPESNYLSGSGQRFTPTSPFQAYGGYQRNKPGPPTPNFYRGPPRNIGIGSYKPTLSLPGYQPSSGPYQSAGAPSYQSTPYQSGPSSGTYKPGRFSGTYRPGPASGTYKPGPASGTYQSGPASGKLINRPVPPYKPPPMAASTAAKYAACVLQEEAGSNVSGILRLEQTSPYGSVSITAEIENLSAGEHGWHIHQLGDVSGGCSSTGGHFNPHGLDHGAPDAAIRHVGDLGNIQGEGVGRVTRVEQSDRLLSLQPSNVNSVIGRAFVVHAGRDDLGLGEESDSKTTGAAGSRLACCTIGIAAEPEPQG